MTNLAALLLEHPFGDDEGLLYTVDRTMTAGTARKEVQAMAASLGVPPGQAVAVQLPNGPDAVIAMVAVWAAGCVFVPVNPRSPADEVARVLSVTSPAALIDASGIRRLDDARTYEPAVAFVLWTSGTSGAPKAILHTHEAYLELLDRVLGPLRASASSARTPAPNLIPVSLALNAGIYNTLFGLRAGAAIVIMDGFSVSSFATLVSRFAIRSTVLPPAAITMLNDSDVVSLEPLKYVRSITAPLSPLQARRFTSRFGVYVLNGYGQAEIGEVIGWTAAEAKEFPSKVGAVGRPHPGVDIRLGPDGRLWVRPPNRAIGYAGGSDLSDRVDESGFVDTGDIARIDDDGFVWIEGRAGDVINRGGNKVFPDDVEEVLRLVPGVVDAGVVGAPDDRLGEVPVAFYTGASVSVSALEAACRQHLAPYKIPVRFHRVDALPRNEAGTLQRQFLSATEAR
jgi:long-chain acyl-CoA synthetase